jgi:hypothetical protein
MAITNVGYTGSIMTDLEWGKVSSHGSSYSVDGAGDFAVSRVPTGDRAVRVAAGTAWGWGILAESPTDLTVTHAAGSRWDTVVIRRNRDTKTTTVMVLQGTAAKAISTARRVFSPSSQIDDQPIALVQVNATSSVVGEIEDLRCWGNNGGLVAASTLVHGYLQSPGASVRIGGVDWSNEPNADGTWQWVRVDSDTGWLTVVGGAGWGPGATGPAVRLKNGRVKGRGYLVRVGGGPITIAYNQPQMGTLPGGIPAPDRELDTTAANNVDPRVGVRVTPQGAVVARAHARAGQAAPVMQINDYISLDNIDYFVG